jgi:hypothetical protein
LVRDTPLDLVIDITRPLTNPRLYTYPTSALSSLNAMKHYAPVYYHNRSLAERRSRQSALYLPTYLPTSSPTSSASGTLPLLIFSKFRLSHDLVEEPTTGPTVAREGNLHRRELLD